MAAVALDERFKSLDERFKSIDVRFMSIDVRLEAMETRFDQRFRAVDQKFDHLDEKIDLVRNELIARMDGLRDEMRASVEMRERVAALEALVARKPGP